MTYEIQKLTHNNWDVYAIVYNLVSASEILSMLLKKGNTVRCNRVKQETSLGRTLSPNEPKVKSEVNSPYADLMMKHEDEPYKIDAM